MSKKFLTQSNGAFAEEVALSTGGASGDIIALNNDGNISVEYLPPIQNRRTITSSETITATDAFISVDSTTENIIITLDATSFVDGRWIQIKWVAGTNSVTIQSIKNIDGATNKVISALYDSYILLANTTEDIWEIR